MYNQANFLRLLMVSVLLVSNTALADKRIELLNRIDQIEKMDRIDFVDAEGKARICIAERNFSCAEGQLEKAKRFATIPKSRKELAAAWQALEEEKELQKAEEEERLAAIRRQEAREAELARRAREEQEEERRDRQRERAIQGTIAYMKGDYGSAAALGVPGADVLSMQQKMYAQENQMMDEIRKTQQQNAERKQQQKAAAEADRLRRVEEARQQASATQVAARSTSTMSPRPVTVNPVTPPTVTINYPNIKCPPGSSWYNPKTGVGAPGGTCFENPGSPGYQGGGYGASTASDTGNATGGGSSNSPVPSAGSGIAQGSTDAAAPKEKPSFRMRPASVPGGSVAAGLTGANGEYKCDAVNDFARQHVGTISQLHDDFMSASYKTEEKCQSRCNLLLWREEFVRTFKYRGSWSCSVAAVETWGKTDVLSGYRNGNNDDRCTCIGQSGAPISFTQ